MTDDALDDLRGITDPVTRARRATEIIDGNTAVIAEASAIRQEALEVLRDTMTNTEIAKATGLTRARVSQLLAGIRPEHALLAPDRGPATICVIEKREAERGRPSIAATTLVAADKLIELAASYDIQAARENVPVPGMIDLNRPNLVVLIGPRSSALVAQAISADPVIRWQPDGHGDWYITDTRTGTEYHSEYDSSFRGSPRTCYAHIGRIRRPDGQGSWLCLAGEHGPGVAGAADLFCRDITALWEKARRSLWSAVARVTAGENGAPVDVALITPIYPHGRR